MSSIKEIAEHIGVSRQKLERQIKLGKITDLSTVEAAKAQWVATVRPKADPQSPHSSESLRDSAAQERYQRARLLKIRADIAERSSIPREEAQAMATDVIIALRESTLNFPSQRGDEIAAELGMDADTVKQVLRRHLSAHMAAASKVLREAAA